MTDLAPVTQADRDAVQAFHRAMFAELREAVQDRKAGERLGEDRGDAGTLVQAFARHRLAHSGDREALIEALENAQRDLQHIIDALPLRTAQSHFRLIRSARGRVLSALSRNNSNG